MLMPKSSPDQVTLEGSPGYLPTHRAIRRVYAMNPCVKLLVTVVHPVQRLISHHAHMIAMNLSHGYRDGKQITDFHEYYFSDDGSPRHNSTGISEGFYYHHLQEWFRYFPRDRLHIVDGVRLRKEPWRELQAIETFLGVPVTTREVDFIFDEDKGFYCHRFKGCLGKRKGLSHPVVSPADLQALNNLYQDSCEMLLNGLNSNMTWVC